MADNRVQIIVQAKDGATPDLKRIEGEFKTLGDAGARSADSIRSTFNKLLTLFAAFKLYETAKQLIDTSANFERLETALKTITGSASKARDAMKWITDFSAKTPYQLEEVTQAFTKLSAQGLDPKRLLGPLGDTASSMSKSLDQAVEMFLDAVRGENERLKEFGVSAQTVGDKIVYHWSENGRDMEVRAKNNAESITEALLKVFSRFKGGMDEQSQTWSGMMSNMSDNWTVFQNKVMTSGPMQSMKAVLSNMLAELDRLSSSGTLDRWANDVGKSIQRLLSNLGLLDTNVQSIGSRFVTFLKNSIDAASSLTATVSPAIKEVTGALGSLLEAYNKWPDEVKGATGTGLLTRLLTGSGTLAGAAAALKLGTDALKEAQKGASSALEERDQSEEARLRRYIRAEQPMLEARTLKDRTEFWGPYTHKLTDPEIAKWAGGPTSTGNPEDVMLRQREVMKKALGSYAYDIEQSRFDSGAKAAQSAGRIFADLEDKAKKLGEAKTPLEEFTVKWQELKVLLENKMISAPEYDKQFALLQEQFDKGLPVEKIKEELAIASAASNQKLQLIKAESDAVDSAHDKGLLSAQDYFGKSTDLVRRSAEERINYLRMERQAQQLMMEKELQSPTKTPLEKEVLTKAYTARMADVDANILAQQNGLSESLRTLENNARQFRVQASAEEVRAIQEITDQYGLSIEERMALNQRYLEARKIQIDLEAQEMLKRLRDPDLVNRWAESQKRAAENAVASKDADRAQAVAQLKSEYAGLTGTIEDQVRASVLLIAAERDRNLLTAQARGASQEELNLIRQVAQERLRLEQLKATGTGFEGFQEGMRNIYNNLETPFQRGYEGAKIFKQGLDDVADAATQMAMTGKVSADSLANSFISQFIRMTIQATITDRIFKAAFGWLGLGGGGSVSPASDINYPAVRAANFHGGGMAEDGFPTRMLPSEVYRNAVRLHSGTGLLGPDEYPAVLLRGERVLNRRETAEYQGGRSPVNVVLNITTPSPTGSAADKNAAQNYAIDVSRIVRAEVVKVIQDQQRSGGILNKGVKA